MQWYIQYLHQSATLWLADTNPITPWSLSDVYTNGWDKEFQLLHKQIKNLGNYLCTYAHGLSTIAYHTMAMAKNTENLKFFFVKIRRFIHIENYHEVHHVVCLFTKSPTFNSDAGRRIGNANSSGAPCPWHNRQQGFKLKMYFSKLPNIFVQIAEYISHNY